MKIKTFPLRMSEEELYRIRVAAAQIGKSMHQFILDATEKEAIEVERRYME